MESGPPALTIRKLLDLCKSDIADLDSMTKSYTRQANTLQFPDLLNDHLYWSYKLLRSDDICPDLVMVGMLKGSKRTGQARLVDHTANIDCVIAPTNTTDSPHQCGQTCTLTSGGTHAYHCPYLHLSTLGSIVRITQFQVIVERFIVSCFPTDADTKNESYVKKTRVCCYLMFSMRDVVRLKRRVVSDRNKECVPTDKLTELVRKKCTSHEPAKRIRLDDVPEDTRHDQQKDDASCSCIVNNNTEEENSESQPLSVPPDRCGRFVDKNHSFSRCVEKDHVDSSAHNEEKQIETNQRVNAQQDISHPMTTSQVFLVTRKDALRVKYRIHSPAALSFFVTVQFLGEAQTCTSVDPEASSLTDSSVVTNVALDIYGNTVSLYPMLHAGCLYRLVKTGPSDSGGFLRQFSSGRLKKALEQTDTCQCLRVDDDYTIMPVQSLPSTHLDRQMKQIISRRSLSCDSVHDVCHSDRRTVELVTFCGLIEGRAHMTPEENKQSDVNRRKTEKDNEKLGVSVPQDRTLRVVVRDCHTPDCVVVYIRPHNISYPLGLLHTVLAEFRRVERRVSKKGNVYCQYISVSSIQVVGLTRDVQPHWTSCGETSLGSSTFSPPVLHLRQLVGPQTTPGDSTVFRCASCQVGRVLSVSLQQKCVLCSRLYRNSRCGCNADLESSNFTASACFSVDDSTATAIVYCYGNLVRQLLALSVSQWTTVQQLVKDHDVNYVSQWGANHGDDSDVESYIHLLCSSTRVLRQVAVSLRRWHSRRRREESYITLATRTPDTRMTTVSVQKQVVVTQKWQTLRLQLVAIEPIDHYGYVSQLIVNMNSAAEK